MYVSFVKDAMVKKSKGQLGPYDELVAQFQVSAAATSTSKKNSATSTAQMQAWLSALTHVAPSLDRTCVSLVEAVTEFPWLAMADEVADAWVRFVCALVSARGEWVTRVASLVFQNLSLYPPWYRAAKQGVLQARTSLTRREMYQRLHSLLQTLLRLIPTLPATLQPLLLQHFPHKRDRTWNQVLYIQNLLRISEYCEALTEPVWSAIIDHALQIDVAIQVEMDELEEQGLEPAAHADLASVLDRDVQSDSDTESVLSQGQEGDDLLETLEDLSDEDDYDASDALFPTSAPTQEPAWNDIAQLAGKLDAIMGALHQFLVRSIGEPTSADVLSRRYQLYQTLLGIFTRSILTTFKSRHIQFLLFWYASLEHEFADMFLGTLLSKSLYAVPAAVGSDSGDAAVILRVAAASYVASYVARARYIDASTTRMVVLNLCTYMDACLESFASLGASAPPPGAREHAVFYAVAQAVFYVFCFRWRDLRDGTVADAPAPPDDVSVPSLAATYPTAGSLELSPQLMPMLHASSLSSVSSTHSATGEQGWAPGLAVVQRAITSPLNPLRYCNTHVVQQFAYVANKTGFLYCYSVLDANAQRAQSDAPEAGDGSSRKRKMASDAARDSPHASGASTPLQGAQTPAALPTPALDVFFPFDPYRLRDSAGLVQRLYREWSDVAPDDDQDDDDDDNDDDDDEVVEHDSDAASDDDDVSALPLEHRTKLSDMLRKSKSQRDRRPYGSSITPESIAHSLEAMSISPYTG